MDEQELSDAIRRAAQTKDKRVIISLTGVSFMTSGMITQLVVGNKFAKSLGVELRIVNASPNVLEVFKITKLNELFEIEGKGEAE